MDNNIVNSVYSTLKEGTESMHKGMDEYKALDEKINSGLYAPKLINEEFLPKKTEIKSQYESTITKTLADAYAMIDNYEQEIAELDALNPDEITDDIKLLQSGIKLNERDIKSMLNRNQGNRTMEQLILRYADEKKIDAGFTYQSSLSQQRDKINGLREVTKRYERYMHDDNAQDVLARFFEIFGE